MADNKIMEEVFKTIDIITDHKLYLTEYVYTEDCTIIAKTNDPYIYRIQHEQQEFDAYSPIGEKFEIGQTVVILFTDYSKITKKIILYGNKNKGEYTKKIADTTILNNLIINGDAYYSNGVTYGTSIPRIQFGIESSTLAAGATTYSFTSEISTVNPFYSTYYSGLCFDSYFYKAIDSAYNSTRIPNGVYFKVGTYSYDPISDRANGSIFDPYRNVKMYNGNNYPTLALGTGSTNGYLNAFYFNIAGYTTAKFVGGIQTDGAGINWYSSSDYRLKTDIAPIENAIEKVKALSPISWRWTDSDAKSEGFLAHEVQEIIPIAVKGEKDAIDIMGHPLYQQLDISKIIPTLTQAIKDLSAQVEIIPSLSQRIIDLSNDIDSLKTEVASLRSQLGGSINGF